MLNPAALTSSFGSLASASSHLVGASSPFAYSIYTQIGEIKKTKNSKYRDDMEKEVLTSGGLSLESHI
jgi:hypothetical protein